ncbi:putative metal-dependent hydrolase [Rivularia sp. PCC 7116]|uniref:M48 family metallopeptidase n=1 Tax=Rivularia sp. PCC 7116 TaxID=373994 RepID=UPI00029F2AF4|nr:SprT family zinc-dependent metalloprotease [Rivularia sp. PCC 7116]AFY58443.1 putative metal-dependent hydrolase [Rivularia sp. PCC 7116]
MPVLQICETSISYSIRHSKRSKRLRIIVSHKGVEVVAPINTPEKLITDFVESKKSWLLKSIEKISHKYPPQTPQSYTDSTEIMYRGSFFTLKIESTDVEKVVIDFDKCFYIKVPQLLIANEKEAAVKQALIDWKREQVYVDILRFAQIYAHKLNVQPKSIKLSQQKRAWGTCSSKGSIRINWRLADAPLPVLEYVVAHEVTHLLHHNHSKDFWQTLGTIMPDWQQRKANLKAWESELLPL